MPTPTERRASRAEALESAASHLELDWTEDAQDRAAGVEVAIMLRGLAFTERFDVSATSNVDRLIKRHPLP